MARKTKAKKDRTGLIISVVFHVLLVGGVIYWAAKTGKIDELRQRFLQFVRSQREQRKEQTETRKADRPPPPPPPPSSHLPKSLTPPTSSGVRRAVASDAPAAAGETFFVDTRKQTTGKSKEGGGGSAESSKPKEPPVISRVVAPAPSRLSLFKPPASTIKQLLQERAQAVASTEAVGTEQIAKSGASDVGSVVGRVASATVVEGKFAVIRGLGDRYVPSLLNGASVPSADPYRRAASLDQFPAQIIDRVVVTKTFTPDLPGTFTGGGIDIHTKGLPAQPYLNLSVGGAYNTQSTWNDHFLSYDGGGTDWLGMDDGSRALPNSLAPGTLVPKWEALTPIGQRPGNPEYDAKVQRAQILNEQIRDLGTTQFKAGTKAPPLDHNLGLSFGDTAYLFGFPVGVNGTLNYNRKFQFYEDGIQQRYQNGIQLRSDYTDARSLTTVNWAAMATVAAQLWRNHEVALNYLFSQTSQDTARHQEGFSQSAGTEDTVFLEKTQYLERNLNTVQLKGTSRLPEAGDIRLDYLAALTQTTQDEPNTRQFNSVGFFGTNIFKTEGNFLPDPQYPSRFYSNMEEQNRNVKFDLTVPFRSWQALEGELKLGMNLDATEREFWERQFAYSSRVPATAWNGPDPNIYLTPENLGYAPTTNVARRIRWNWNRTIDNFDSSYDAERTVNAAYCMTDMELTERLRLVGGARMERTEQSIHSESFFESYFTGLRVNDTEKIESQVLPAVGLIYSLRDDMKLRAGYSQTLARPSFRELAAYRSYDPNLDIELEGNPTLQISTIENYDLRWEWFPRPGEILSASVFYKKLAKPIEPEFITNDGKIMSWDNRSSAEIMGFEFEARKTLDLLHPSLANFSVGGNLSLIKSTTDLTEDEFDNKNDFFPNLSKSRPLAESSPYILNVDLSYDNRRSGTSVSMVFNLFGPRLVVAALNTEDIYEQPAPSLDLILSQRLGRNLSAKFTAKNLLDPVRKLTYGEAGKQIFSTYKVGMTFGLSLAYQF